jgi:hypothetical protein
MKFLEVCSKKEVTGAALVISAPALGGNLISAPRLSTTAPKHLFLDLLMSNEAIRNAERKSLIVFAPAAAKTTELISRLNSYLERVKVGVL